MSYSPITKTVQELGCYTPATPLVAFFFPFPQGGSGSNGSWDLSLDAGNNYTPGPADVIDEPVSAAFGDIRYRQIFTVPTGYGGTFDVTISGDISDAATLDPGRIFYDGVDQGVISPINGPDTFTLAATPGFHVFEFQHGATDPTPGGLIAPIITVDYSSTTTSPDPFTVLAVTRVDDQGLARGISYFDALGNQIFPQPGDSVALGACQDCCPINVGEGCWDDGLDSGVWVSIRDNDGTITLIDPLTNLTVDPGDVVDCPAPSPVDNDIDSTVQRLTGAGNINIPAGARAISVVVITGSPTLQIGADPVITLTAGLTLSWSVDDRNESLLNAYDFTGVLGSDFYVITTRL